jgi:hypothetical protein
LQSADPKGHAFQLIFKGASESSPAMAQSGRISKSLYVVLPGFSMPLSQTYAMPPIFPLRPSEDGNKQCQHLAGTFLLGIAL